MFERARIGIGRATAWHWLGALLLLGGAWALGGDTSGAALVCNKTWSGPAGGAWETAANWSGGTLPTSTSTVCSASGSSIVLSSASTVLASKLDG